MVSIETYIVVVVDLNFIFIPIIIKQVIATYLYKSIQLEPLIYLFHTWIQVVKFGILYGWELNWET